ncbi:unnamed protein product [Durusdinium trenchii]|uniref:Uncharacterized protein n=2 Tax=Durusdinium trenchii TaxID=1381693 RepID=A0ABP0MFZ7_9DINO
METAPPYAKSTQAWRKKRAFTGRYLESVWPRSYWNRGPVSILDYNLTSSIHSKSVSNLPLARFTQKGSVRPASRSTREKRRETRKKVAWEHETVGGSQSSLEPSLPETPTVASEVAAPETRMASPFWHAEIPPMAELSAAKVLADQKRQQVYLKMGQIGSLKLILAQVEAGYGTDFKDFRHTLP